MCRCSRRALGTFGSWKPPLTGAAFSYLEEFMSASYRLAERHSGEPTVVRAGSARFGDGGFALIGGPCAIEGEAQIEAAAAAVASAGAAMLRGGAYKPRTSPYDFQGLGDAGLPLISRAGANQGVPVVVEALAEGHVPLVAASCDMLQIGARNMQNVPLLRAAARTGRPILLKRGPAATLDELLYAAEYILVEGNGTSSCASAESKASIVIRATSPILPEPCG